MSVPYRVQRCLHPKSVHPVPVLTLRIYHLSGKLHSAICGWNQQQSHWLGFPPHSFDFPCSWQPINILIWEYRCNFFKDEFLFLSHVSCFEDYFWEGMCQQTLIQLLKKRRISGFSFLNAIFAYLFKMLLLFTKTFNKLNLYISRVYLLILQRCVLFYILFKLYLFLIISLCSWVKHS